MIEAAFVVEGRPAVAGQLGRPILVDERLPQLRRCTDRNGKIVDFYLYLTAALLTVRRLIQRARKLYRWVTGPTV